MGHRKRCSQGEGEGSGRGRFPGAALGYCSAASPLGLAEKPGACPAAAPEGPIAPCSFPCLEDKDCLGAQKCCPLGCGSACLEPAQGKDSAGTAGSPGSPQGPYCAIAVSLTPWPLGEHTQLSLHRQLLTAVGKTHRWDMAAGTRNVRVMAGTRDLRGRQGGQWGMLNRHTPSILSDQPKPSEGPTVQPGPSRERCRGDGDCPDAQKCSNSSCSHQRLPGEPAGEAGWDRMGSEGEDTAQRPGLMLGVAATMAQSCGTIGTHACQGGLCRVWGGDTLHCTAPRWALEWGGKGTVQPPSGEATIML